MSCPIVKWRVPVLSRTTVSTRDRTSRCNPPLIMAPFWAACPIAPRTAMPGFGFVLAIHEGQALTYGSSGQTDQIKYQLWSQ